MKNFIILIISFFVLDNAIAQSPQAFNYQGVARDLSGQILNNKNINLKILITKDNESGPILYSETHNIITNNLGLFNIKIGKGNILFSGIENINWGNGPFFIRIEMDPSGGNNFEFLGATQLLSVPYSLYAEKTNLQAGGGINVEGNKITNIGDLSNTNELQNLEIQGNKLTISNGNTVSLPTNQDSKWIENNFGLYYKNKPILIGGDEGGKAPLNIFSKSDTLLSFKYKFGDISHVPYDTYLKYKPLLVELEQDTIYIENALDLNASIRLNDIRINTAFSNYGNTIYSNNYFDWSGFYYKIGNNRAYGGLFASDYLIHSENGSIIFQTKKNKVVKITQDSDLYLNNKSTFNELSGIILRSPNGKCWKQTVDNSGVFKSTEVTCPD